MSNVIDISVLGDRRLQQKLNRLVEKDAKKIVRQAMRAAARPVHARAVELAPKKTGALAQNIKINAATSATAKAAGIKAARGSLGVVVRTGTRAEMGIDPSSKWYYPAIVEYGHDNAPAKSYLRRAMDETRGEAIAIAARMIGGGIIRASRKGGLAAAGKAKRKGPVKRDAATGRFVSSGGGA